MVGVWGWSGGGKRRRWGGQRWLVDGGWVVDVLAVDCAWLGVESCAWDVEIGGLCRAAASGRAAGSERLPLVYSGPMLTFCLPLVVSLMG